MMKSCIITDLSLFSYLINKSGNSSFWNCKQLLAHFGTVIFSISKTRYFYGRQIRNYNH